MEVNHLPGERERERKSGRERERKGERGREREAERVNERDFHIPAPPSLHPLNPCACDDVVCMFSDFFLR